MQVLAPSRRIRPARLIPPIVTGLVVGGVLLAGGFVLGYLTLGTSFLQRFTPVGRVSEAQMAAGAIAWSVGLTAPALFVIVGAVRLFGVAELVGALRPKQPPLARLASTLTDEYVVATKVRLPDGRRIPQLVLGPFGLAVVEEAPPAAATRRQANVWEVRMQDGRWRPLENPLDRAARDADGVRRWLGGEDRDFVAKVYAALIVPSAALERTSACAVVAPDQIGAWLQSLAPQRSLTESRRDDLLELIRSAI
jgi:hypothetical protein